MQYGFDIDNIMGLMFSGQGGGGQSQFRFQQPVIPPLQSEMAPQIPESGLVQDVSGFSEPPVQSNPNTLVNSLSFASVIADMINKRGQAQQQQPLPQLIQPVQRQIQQRPQTQIDQTLGLLSAFR